MNAERYRTLLDQLQIGIVVHAPDTSILYANQFAAKLLGLQVQEMEGRVSSDPHWSFIDEKGAPLGLSDYPVNRVLKALKPSLAQVVGIRSPDGSSVVWALCNAYPVLDPQKKLQEIVVNFTDITAEKELKEKLSDLNQLMQSALDQSQAGVAIADARSGKLRYLNQAAFLMKKGLAGEHIKDIDVNTLASAWNMSDLKGNPLKSEEMPLVRALKYGEKSSKEVYLKLPNQEPRVMWVNAAPILNPEGKVSSAILVLLDTTERHRLAEELHRTQQMAEAATIAKTRFLDVAAHELRTPITVLSLLLQFTEQQKERGHAVELETLTRLRNQVERISRLVVDLLDVSRLERGALPISPKPTDLKSLIQECVEDFKLYSATRVLTFQGPTEKVQANVDPIRIYQVITNLLENSRRLVITW